MRAERAVALQLQFCVCLAIQQHPGCQKTFELGAWFWLRVPAPSSLLAAGLATTMPAEAPAPAVFLSKWKATMLLQCGIPLIVPLASKTSFYCRGKISPKINLPRIHAMDYLVQLNQTRAADDPLFWRQATDPNRIGSLRVRVCS